MVAHLDRETLVREKKKIALMSVALNLFLSVMKITVGLISGSAALVADGIHSLADLAAALSVYAGIVIANFRSKEFPYGLYKVENLISLVSAFAIFFAGYEIVRDVLFADEVRRIENLPLALSAVVITLVATYLFSRWERKKGEELNSPSLIADAEHIKTDFFSSLIVLVGILGNYFGFPWVEKLAVLVIAVLIFRAGWEIAVEALKVLLDASVDRETLEKVRAVMESHPLVEEVKSVIGRSSGSYKFIEAELVLKTDDFERAHAAVHEIEERVKKTVPFIERLIIHFEPPEERERRIALLLDGEGKLCREPEGCKRVVVFVKKGKTLVEDGGWSLQKPLVRDKGSCAELFERLAEEKVDCLVVGRAFFGKGALYAAAYYGIEVGVFEGTVEELLRRLEGEEGGVCRPASELLRKLSSQTAP
ncbi:MAG: cation transporter [Aquificae bacterium]|nr:cation transporter [Aquificota bacterium]